MLFPKFSNKNKRDNKTMKYEVEVTKDYTVWGNPETKQLHRLDGPACEHSNGDKKWYIDGKLHRTDGPAMELSNGDKSWWVDGYLHRLDGPAVEYSNGYKLWYVKGEYYSKFEFDNLLKKVKLSTKVKPCSGKVVIVDGIEYALS